MRVVVVGGSGNVGTAVLRRLVAEPAVDSLGGVVRRPPAGGGPPYDRVDWTPADLGTPAAPGRLRSAFAGADAVVHLAWRLQPGHDLGALERINVGGSRAVVDAALAAGVRHLVYASSVGAYAPAPDDRRRDESWPTTGVRTSTYSRQKAAVERILDAVDQDRLAVARIRPGIVLQPAAAAEIARYFLGPLLPTSLLGPLLRPGRLPLLAWPRGLRLQIVHADDLADAFARALLAGTTGGLNVATEPVLGRELVARLLRPRAAVDVPAGVVRALATLAWTARLQPTEAGWIDLATSLPLLDTSRARTELGWTPQHGADDVLAEFLPALASGRGDGDSPALVPRGPVAGRRATG